MPIEIKELHIKINVDSDKGKAEDNKNLGKKKQDIVAACVEQVMDLLASKSER